MNNFSQFNIPQSLQDALKTIGFNEPTPIQMQAIPLALEGRDILGSAQTGTGKTGAFGIPLISKLIENPRGVALVLTPTRELAMQVQKAIQSMITKADKINTALLIGGEPMPKQLQQLRLRPRLIVGTPGRINDHLERGTLMLHDANFLVLDETDRMLDMGFSIQIENILRFMPKKRQTMLFSATLPNDIISMANRFLVNPQRVAVGDQSAPATNIKHEILHVAEAEKYTNLLSQLETREGSVIVFVKTKWNAEKMAQRLRGDFIEADAIHGDLRQNKRDKVISSFRGKKFRVLVATDIAARGLDIPHIEHVINYDLPQCAEDYIHRIGRTARAGAEGSAICFISREDGQKWAAINRLLDPSAPAPKRASGNGGGARNGGARKSNTRRPDAADWRSDFKKKDGDNAGFRGDSRGGERNSESRGGEFRGARKEGGFKKEGFRSERSSSEPRAERGEGRSQERRPNSNPNAAKAQFSAKPFNARTATADRPAYDRASEAPKRREARPDSAKISNFKPKDGAPRVRSNNGDAPAARRTVRRKTA